MGIIGIHNNIDPKPPLYTGIVHPKNFKTKYEEDKFWDGRFKLWHDGNGSLTGMHIFYLDECTIADENGQAIRPHWRDCDSEIFESWNFCVKNQHDLMCIKRREVGLSTFGGGVLPLYTALTKPGSDSVMTSASKKRLETLFRKKTEFIYDRLNPYYREQKARKTQSGQLFIAKEDKVNKTFSGLQSSIHSIDTVKDKFGFESYRASYIFLDEQFLHPHSAEVKASANSSRMKGFTRISPILLGGTCGDMSNKGAQEGRKVYESSKESRTAVIFLGGTKGVPEFSVNGHCDERAAEEFILKRREELSKSPDKTEYFKFLTSYPLSILEVFNLVTDCALPQEVQVTLNDAEKKISTEKIVLGKYSMQSDSVKVIANPDEMKGKVNILFPPQKGHIYISGTDPIPFGNNSLGEGSEYSQIIFDDTTKEIAADYTERSFDSQIVVRNSILLQRLYKSDMFPHGAPTMLELNRGEVVLKEYLSLGAEKLLAPMPLHLGIIYEERKYPFGIYMNNQIAARCEALCMKFLLAHGFKLRHKRAIQEFRYLSTKTNTDVLDAIKMALLFSEELAEMKKKQTPTYTNHKIVQLTRNSITHKLERREVESSILNR